jgi:hypothetical protein
MWLSVVIQCDYYYVFCTLSHPVLLGSAIGPLGLFIFILCIIGSSLSFGCGALFYCGHPVCLLW